MCLPGSVYDCADGVLCCWWCWWCFALVKGLTISSKGLPFVDVDSAGVARGAGGLCWGKVEVELPLLQHFMFALDVSNAL